MLGSQDPVHVVAEDRRSRGLNRPRQSMRHLGSLVVALALRDVSTRYKHSFLGLYWALVNPLITSLIFAFVFGSVLKAQPAGHVPYAVFLVVNLTLWSFFANSLTSATSSVVQNGSLISKIYFPRLVLPTAAVVARVVDFTFSAGAVAIFMLFYRIRVGWVLPLFLLAFVVLFVLALGVSYFVAALNVMYRDTSQIVGVVIMLWMYLSPVMYTAAVLPAKVRFWVDLNPISGALEFAQAIIFTHHLPSFGPLLYSAAVSIGLLCAGSAYFRHMEDAFGEIM